MASDGRPNKARSPSKSTNPRQEQIRPWRRSVVIPVRPSFLRRVWTRLTTSSLSRSHSRSSKPSRQKWRLKPAILVLVPVLVLLVVGGGSLLFLKNGGRFPWSPEPEPTLTGSVVGDHTMLECIRGATEAALSTEVPAATLAASGILAPVSVAVVASASAVGCAIGAFSTTTMSMVEWVFRHSPSWFSAWFGQTG